MIKGACHCNNIRWSFEGQIERVTSCNCTVCRRYGGLWAYGFKDQNIIVAGTTREYVRGDAALGFHFCGVCGCVAYWLGRFPNTDGHFRIAVNMRLALEPEHIQSIPIRHFDGLDKFEALADDSRCVKDLWF
ncbi:MAG: GFA family protein [Deltaproteobacteria bacterium]|nr:GFA family protein [Deltaproteobacteria bacterium]